MYIVKTKENNVDVFKAYYSKPINPFYVAKDYYSNGDSFMNSDEADKLSEDLQNPELMGICGGVDEVDAWGDTTNNNECILLSGDFLYYILQAQKVEYDKAYYVELKV